MGSKQEKALAVTFKDYGDNSSVHGVSYITSSSASHVDKLLWSCLVCLGLALAAYMSAEAYIDWQSSPVITSLKDTSKQVSTMMFPSVTICTEGVNLEAVKTALVQDFRAWKQDNKIKMQQIWKKLLSNT